MAAGRGTAMKNRESMRPALHVIAWPGPGRLATMAHPRGGARLADEMAGLARAGVDVFVSALTWEEDRRLGLTQAAAAARAAGVELVSFPIADRFVVTQCFAGIGRSALLACATLVMLGIGPENALRMVSHSCC